MRNTNPQDMISIYVTDYCNCKCVFCSMDSPNEGYEQMSRERIGSILANQSNRGYFGIALYGGEPTTRSDFFEILTEIKQNNFQYILLETNGRMLADRAFAEKAMAMGVDLFIISIHGKDKETQDYLSQINGCFEQVIQGIENVKALGGLVRTNTVVNQQNYQQLPEIQEMLINLGVEHINISALRTIGMAKRNFEIITPRYSEMKPYLQAAAAKVSQSGVRFSFDVIPLCIMKGYEASKLEWHNFKMYFRSITIENFAKFTDTNLKVKGEPCGRCAYSDQCGGVFKEYAEAFGWDEFGY